MTLNSSCLRNLIDGASSFMTSSGEVIGGLASSKKEALLFPSSKAASIVQALANPMPFTRVSSWIEAVKMSRRLLSNAWSNTKAISEAFLLFPGEINKARSSQSDRCSISRLWAFYSIYFTSLTVSSVIVFQ